MEISQANPSQEDSEPNRVECWHFNFRAGNIQCGLSMSVLLTWLIQTKFILLFLFLVFFIILYIFFCFQVSSTGNFLSRDEISGAKKN